VRYDLITYCPDTAALMAEVGELFPERLMLDSDDAPVGFSIDKTPTIRAGLETLSIVRVTADDLVKVKQLSSLTILSEVEAYGDLLADMDGPARAIYDRVHTRPIIEVKDEAGNVTGTTQSPELIGGFQ